MMQTDIFSVLSTAPAISAICGTKIYPQRIPQNIEAPAVVYTVNELTPVKSLSGESGLENGTIEIVCFAKDYTTAHLLASAVRSAFIASGISVLTWNMQDLEDEETHNFGVLLIMTAWSSASVGTTPQNLKNPIGNMAQASFVGDDSTVEFPLPKFRSGSLLVFFNGRLSKKGEPSDLTAAYWEKSTLDGFVFRVAPKGGDYADELLAFYAAN